MKWIHYIYETDMCNSNSENKNTFEEGALIKRVRYQCSEEHYWHLTCEVISLISVRNQFLLMEIGGHLPHQPIIDNDT